MSCLRGLLLLFSRSGLGLSRIVVLEGSNIIFIVNNDGNRISERDSDSLTRSDDLGEVAILLDFVTDSRLIGFNISKNVSSGHFISFTEVPGGNLTLSHRRTQGGHREDLVIGKG